MLERARITAVQQQHHPPGAAAVHPPVDELGGHGSRPQPPQPGVSRSEVQLAVFVLDSMTGEVQQQQIIGLAVGEELLHRQVHLVSGLIEQGAHLEIADDRITQYRRKRQLSDGQKRVCRWTASASSAPGYSRPRPFSTNRASMVIGPVLELEPFHRTWAE